MKFALSLAIRMPRKQIIFVEDKKKLTPSFKRNLAEILSERDAISKVIRRKS